MAFVQNVLSGKNKSVLASVLRGLAWVASRPYSSAMRLRNLGYDKGWLKSAKLDVPVISIGNLTVGGTGKTPAVAMVCRYLRNQGIRVAIVSRGYGAENNGQNDEAMELELQLPDVPHVQNADRVAAAQLAHEELDTQLVVMDDGFQHRRLKRDLEIVLLDATEPFGFGYVLPRGLLRESISGLRRADIVIATRADQVDEQKLADIRTRMQRYATGAVWAEAIHMPKQLRSCENGIVAISELQGKPCVLFCGIGNPTAFERTVNSLGATIRHKIEFPDHHNYDSDDIAALEAAVKDLSKDAEEKPAYILCTGKDLSKVNLPAIGGVPLYALEVEMELRYGRDAFEERLQRIVQLALSFHGEDSEG